MGRGTENRNRVLRNRGKKGLTPGKRKLAKEFRVLSSVKQGGGYLRLFVEYLKLFVLA